MENTENEKLNVENAMPLTEEDFKKPYVLTESQQLFLKALPANNFDISATAKALGYSRGIYYYWSNNNPDFSRAVDDAFEELKDAWEAEGNFAIQGQYTINKDENGQPNELDQNGVPIRHYINLPDRGFLKFKHLTKMKSRGYVYRQEVTGAEGKDLFDGFEIDLTKPSR